MDITFGAHSEVGQLRKVMVRARPRSPAADAEQLR
jgi:arginine deiminase